MMEWINLHKDVLGVAIPAVSLVVSIWAMIRANRAAKETASLTKAERLSEIHDKIQDGREAIQRIWREWNAKEQREEGTPSAEDKKKFISFYNEKYHESSDETNANMSKLIHLYLHELHDIWDQVGSKVFERKAVLQKLGEGIYMDKNLIDMYLNAHWQKHDRLKLPEKQRFWSNVPIIIGAVEKWKRESDELERDKYLYF